MKWRNSKERELLASGGSREQTLPNKNNPNPDLSDVNETFVASGDGQRSVDRANLEDIGDDEDRSTPTEGAEEESFDSDMQSFTPRPDVECSGQPEPLESLIAASHLTLSQAVARSSESNIATISRSNNAQSSSLSPKLLIKNLSTLGGAETFSSSAPTTESLTFSAANFRPQRNNDEHIETYSDDEDINVTDDMTASNNEDSDGD